MKMLAGTAAFYGNMVGESFFLFQASTFVDVLHDAAAEGNWGKLRSIANQYIQSFANPGSVRWLSRQTDRADCRQYTRIVRCPAAPARWPDNRDAKPRVCIIAAGRSAAENRVDHPGL